MFISDEDDNSPGWNDSEPDYWLEYVNQIIHIKGREDQVRFSAIIGPVSDGCNGAEPGFGYHEAVTWTGGEQLNICDTWWEEIEILADAGLLHQTEFFLEYPALEASITVEVNHAPVVAGWVYDSQQISVFSNSSPRTGDLVEINYHAL